MRTFALLLCIPFLLMGCQPTAKEQQATDTPPFDLQGHRGCRGLLPENSIPAFKKALELGVNTLELDLSISADSQVLLSHEPWLSADFCADTEGERIPEDSREQYNLFAMTYEEIAAYDCGSLPNARFPEQERMSVAKPLLREVMDTAESYAATLGRPLPYYNIEIKRHPSGDNVFHPEVQTFIDLVLAELDAQDIWDRVVIQCFDFETLQLINEQRPEIKLVALVENEEGPAAHLQRLGFTPEVYSPWSILVDAKLIAFAAEQNMQVIPWTVNDTAEMKHLIELGVDGLITDYPDRFRADWLKTP